MLKVYNTRTRTKESLPATKKDTPLRFFVCGPTVYDDSHIGHARTYSFFDSFIKYLRLKQKINVQYLQNITDIDDKIINRANEKNIDTKELSEKYTKRYFEDMENLSINSIDKYAKATEHIDEIIKQIEILINKGYAYENNGSVYFRVNKFKNYGLLSGQKIQQLQESDRDANTHSSEKEAEQDFVIWKKSKEQEPSWRSPYGEGRPGWHIEDTAITYAAFNSPTYEMHGGAQDLIFPHHEAEVALMESAYEESPFVNIWMHTGFLNVNGEKMSKSLGNFTTIKEILKQTSPQALRLFFATKHYRSPIDYTETSITESSTNQSRIQDLKNRLEKIKASKNYNSTIHNKAELFWESLEDDFNTPRAFSILFEIITDTNKLIEKNEVDEMTKDSVLTLIDEINKIFFIIKKEHHTTIPKEIYSMAQQRQKHRQKNEWDLADEIRKEIEKKGYEIEDIKGGFNIHKQ